MADTFRTLLGIQEPVPKKKTSGNGLPENNKIIMKWNHNISNLNKWYR